MNEMLGNHEMEANVVFIELGDAAEGAIEAGPHQQERLDELTQRVGAGEFLTATDGTLPCGCVDGRPGGAVRPNAAGGTETVFVADDLTTKRFAADDGSTLGAYKNVLTQLQAHGYEVGGHTDDHAHGDASGCGANDKLPVIYNYIARKSDVIRATAELLGVVTDDATHELIVNNAAARNEFSKGGELLNTLREQAGSEVVDPLQGGHQEVLAVVNKRTGTTLNREALAAEFGLDYESFNVDVWTFEESARATSVSEEEVQQKVVAMVYYNLATTYVLAGQKLRVVVIE